MERAKFPSFLTKDIQFDVYNVSTSHGRMVESNANRWPLEIETFVGEFIYLRISANRQWPEASGLRCNHLIKSARYFSGRECARLRDKVWSEVYARGIYDLLLNTVYTRFALGPEHVGILTATCSVAPAPTEN